MDGVVAGHCLSGRLLTPEGGCASAKGVCGVEGHLSRVLAPPKPLLSSLSLLSPLSFPRMETFKHSDMEGFHL